MLLSAGVAKGAPLAEADPEAYADSYGYAPYGQGYSYPPLYQVCSILSVSFFAKKIINLPGRQINDPSWENTYSLRILLATPSSPPCALLCGTTKKQGQCQVCQARQEGPMTPSRQKATAPNLDCAFVENGLSGTAP